jgi:hypothetical protein
MGSGKARSGKIGGADSDGEVMGSGSATVAPSEKLTATIMLSGNLHLVTRPASIQRSIKGTGHRHRRSMTGSEGFCGVSRAAERSVQKVHAAEGATGSTQKSSPLGSPPAATGLDGDDRRRAP